MPNTIIGAAQLLLQNARHLGDGQVVVCTLDVEALQRELLDLGVGAPEPFGVTAHGEACPQCGGALTKDTGIVEEPALRTGTATTMLTSIRTLTAFMACSTCEFCEKVSDFKLRVRTATSKRKAVTRG